MSIQQRKIKATGGGSSASGVGVQQLAVPKNNLGSSVSSLAKSLGVLMDTSLSPHEEKKLDIAVADEYKKIQFKTAGRPQVEQDAIVAQARKDFDEANPQGFIDNMLGRDNKKLQYFDKYATQDVVNHVSLTRDNLVANIPERATWVDIQRDLDAVYKNGLERAEEMSPEVAEMYIRNISTDYDNTIKTQRMAHSKREVAYNEALAKSNASTTAMNSVPSNLRLNATNSATDMQKLQESMYIEDGNGNKVLDPFMFGTIKQAVKQGTTERIDFGSQTSKKDLHLEEMKQVQDIASALHNPDIYRAWLDEVQPNGETRAEMEPKEAQTGLESLLKKERELQDRLVQKDQATFKANSKAYKENTLIEYQDLQIRAEGGDQEAIDLLRNSTTRLRNARTNDPNIMSNADYIATMNEASVNEKMHRSFVSSGISATHDENLKKAMADAGSIEDINDLILDNNEASPAVMQWAKAKYADYEKMVKASGFESKDTFNEWTKSIKDSADKASMDMFDETQDELEVELDEFKRVTANMPNIAIPSEVAMASEMRQAWRKTIYDRTKGRTEPMTGEDWQGLADEFIQKEIPRYKLQYKRQLKQYMKDNTPVDTTDDSTPSPTGGGGGGTTDGSELNPFSEPQAKSTFEELNTKASAVLGDSKPSELSPVGGVEADKERKVQLQVDEFRKNDPVGFVKKAVETGNVGLARDVLTEGVVDTLKGTDANVYDVVTELITNLGENHPELIGTGSQVDTNLQELSNIILDAVKQLGQNSDERVRGLHNYIFKEFLHDRDNKDGVSGAQLSEILGVLQPRYEGTPIGESHNKMQEALSRLRGSE